MKGVYALAAVALCGLLYAAAVRITAHDTPDVNRDNKTDALTAVVFKTSGNNSWASCPMGIREARAYQASVAGTEVYVEGTDEYDDTVLVYDQDCVPEDDLYKLRITSVKIPNDWP